MTQGPHDEPVPTLNKPVYQRILAVFVAGLAFMFLLQAAGSHEVPYVSLGPGPTFDLLGNGFDDDGKDTGTLMVSVEGKSAEKNQGHLRLVTVSVADQLSMNQAILLWFSGDQQLVPREEVYPSNTSRDQIDQQNTADFSHSEEAAETAALVELGNPTRPVIQQVEKDSPAEGLLADGDWIVAIDGTAVSTPNEVISRVGERAPGDAIDVSFEREEQGTLRQHSARIVAAAMHNESARPRLGIVLKTGVRTDSHVKIAVPSKIGGPSGGLMFAMAVVDRLTPGGVTRGIDIAGTGTINENGEVGPIGGITHKMLGARRDGATVFLVPEKNCAEAASHVPEGLHVVKVANLHEAVQDLAALRQGKIVPDCS